MGHVAREGLYFFLNKKTTGIHFSEHSKQQLQNTHRCNKYNEIKDKPVQPVLCTVL